MDTRRRAVVLTASVFVAVAVGVSFLPAALGGVVGADAYSDSTVEFDDNSQLLDETSSQSEGASVAEPLDSATGETTVIVQLAEPAGSLGETPEQSVATLKGHAELSQEPVVRFADAHEGVTVERQFWITNAVLLTVDTDRVPLAEVAAVDGVTAVEENSQVRALDAQASSPDTSLLSPSDSLTQQGMSSTDATYGLDMINAPETWQEFGTQGEGVRVAVLDTGIDAEHPDIDLHTDDPNDPTYPGGWAEFDTSGNQIEGSEPYDVESHGTHVSGTVGGGDASGTHIGVSPGVELTHGGVLMECIEDDGDEFCGTGTRAQVLGGMEWAVDNDADIMSLSLGASEYDDEYATEVRNAEAAGVLVVAASGNDGEETSNSPGNTYESFSVGAVDWDEEVASFSSGEVVSKDDFDDPPADWPDVWIVPDVTAPGVYTESTVPGGDYEPKSGTSMATPHVSGTAALMLSTNPDLTPEETRQVLADTARKPAGEPVEQDTRYGNGIIDAHGATSAVSAQGVQGTVIGESTGEGIDGVTVTLSNDDGEITTTTTDEHGEYWIEHEESGTFQLAIDAGFSSETTDTEIGSIVETVDVTLDDTVTVDGTVTEDVTGEPVQNATVTVAANDDETTVDTDEHGEYSVGAVFTAATTDATVDVAASGFEPDSDDASIADTSAVTVDRVLVGTASLTGTVTEAGTDIPIEGGTVTVERDGTTYETETDSAGTYEFAALKGADEYDISITASGFTETTDWGVEVADGADETADYALTGNASLSGTVTEAGTDATIEGATVTAERNDVSYETETDSAGTYEFTALKGADEYDIAVSATGFEDETETGVEIADEVAETADYALTGNASLSGTITEAGTEAPIEDATIIAERNGISYETTTDENGEYTFEALKGDDEYGISVAAAGFEGESDTGVQIDEGENMAAYELTGTASLTGTVTDTDTNPIDSVTITAERDGVTYEAITNQDGEYTIEALKGDDEYTVTAAKPGYATNATDRSIADSDVAVMNFELTSGGTVTGTVTASDSAESLPGVLIEHDADSTVPPVETDDCGTYSIRLPEGEQSITASLENFEPRTEMVDISVGEATERDFALDPKPASVSGTVTDIETDDPLEGTIVSLSSEGETYSVETDEDGAYQLQQIPRGEYELSVSHPDYEEVDSSSLSLAANADKTGVDVALTPKPGVIEGQIIDGAGEPLANATAQVTGEEMIALDAKTDADGTYSFAVPRGEYTAKTTKQAYESDTTTLTVGPNETVAHDVTIVQLPVYFDVIGFEAPDAVEQGDTIDIAADVDNLGAETGTMNVEYRFDGETVDTTELTLDAGAKETTALSYAIPDDTETGEYDHGVHANTSATGTITVQEAEEDTSGGGGGGGGAFGPPDFQVTITDTNSPVDAGERLDVSVTLRNEGDRSDTQSIELVYRGEVVDSSEQRVAGGQQRFLTLAADTSAEDIGEQEITVRSADSEDSTTVVIDGDEPAGEAEPSDDGDDDSTPPDSDDGDEDEPTDEEESANGDDGTTDDVESEPGDEGTDDESLPGFGPLAGVLAVLLTVVLLARR
ncbi:carboxypeptidase regulatory-like domain-containing protein [Natranaeroarchaeum aerophilus]|uniref:Carboxypeptidase regulatory-like domain-containing protein n=1 Tax=Natranaeroarchaeum aerophilus TaxID=2917711 RepID=A0AAE3FNB0_9EURY|nr:carboxypeptidase regulatory-like domain-containing protein [Natranaeroarchaeum aerophilus]MCL9812289.1 carboxypeptidase regulatory-like domain-containing protein [Natranaeroarchaeum aerophilus]